MWFRSLLVLLVLVRRCRCFKGFAEASMASLLLLSPIMHAWYATWLVLFSVVTCQLGSCLLGLSIFTLKAPPNQSQLSNLPGGGHRHTSGVPQP